MPDIDASRLHWLLAPARRRIAYKKSDYPDYLLMLLACAAIVRFSFADAPALMWPGLTLCGVMAWFFPLRHGASLQVPVILREPMEALYMLVYKVRNIKPGLLIAVGVLLLDNLFIRLTPQLPHKTALMHEIALGFFYAHVVFVSLYRTAILVTHLRRREHVREFLMQTAWKGALAAQPNVTLQIVHAYVTGLLTHLILLAPWYLVIAHFDYSAITVIVVSVVNVAGHLLHMRSYSQWFYRDHWLTHSSEFEFVYLHGTHHDAIPTALIGVSGNGLIEGFLRATVGNPMSLYSPLVAFVLHTVEVVQDMKMHQYVPGVYPRLSRSFHEVAQHSTHHFGRLEPYGIGLRMQAGEPAQRKRRWFDFPPAEILNSISLDEKLNGFKWDNPRYELFMELFDKYEEPANDGR